MAKKQTDSQHPSHWVVLFDMGDGEEECTIHAKESDARVRWLSCAVSYISEIIETSSDGLLERYTEEPEMAAADGLFIEQFADDINRKDYEKAQDRFTDWRDSLGDQAEFKLEIYPANFSTSAGKRAVALLMDELVDVATMLDQYEVPPVAEDRDDIVVSSPSSTITAPDGWSTMIGNGPGDEDLKPVEAPTNHSGFFTQMCTIMRVIYTRDSQGNSIRHVTVRPLGMENPSAPVEVKVLTLRGGRDDRQVLIVGMDAWVTTYDDPKMEPKIVMSNTFTAVKPAEVAAKPTEPPVIVDDGTPTAEAAEIEFFV